MKKEYITPQLYSMNVDCSSVLCSSIQIGIDKDTVINDETQIWSNSEGQYNSTIWND